MSWALKINYSSGIETLPFRLKSSKRLANSAQIWATKLLEEVGSLIGKLKLWPDFQGSYELSNSNDYGESIAMKFKFNITKTGLPDGDIIVGDWYEGKNDILARYLLVTLKWLELDRDKSLYIVFSHKIMCFEDI